MFICGHATDILNWRIFENEQKKWSGHGEQTLYEIDVNQRTSWGKYKQKYVSKKYVGHEVFFHETSPELSTGNLDPLTRESERQGHSIQNVKVTNVEIIWKMGIKSLRF